MSLDTIRKISQAEEAAKEEKASAQFTSAKMLHDAQEKSAALVNAAMQRANEEVKHLLSQADVKAEEMKAQLQSGNANRQAAMRAHAEARMEDAARLIVERIVSS